MITIRIPTNKLTMVFSGDSMTVSIKDLDAAQFRRMAEKLVEQEGSAVTLRNVTMKEGF